MKKIIDGIKSVEDKVFNEKGERDIDLSVPGVTKTKIELKKHKTGIYSAKKTHINYPVIIIVGIIIVIIIILNLL